MGLQASQKDEPCQKADDSISHFSASYAAIPERSQCTQGSPRSRGAGEGGGVQKCNQEDKDLGKETQIEAKMDSTQTQEKKNKRSHKINKRIWKDFFIQENLYLGFIILQAIYSTEAKVQGLGRSDALESQWAGDQEANVRLSS